ncbi:MAG: hypothetical protein RLZZ312_1171, partial [Bacteroidota bacterium]
MKQLFTVVGFLFMGSLLAQN